MKQTNRKGFTLAELLIVVAIISVLVAIAIPVFTSQLHNARVAADVADIRSYYAELQTDFMTNGKLRNDLIPSYSFISTVVVPIVFIVSDKFIFFLSISILY